MLELCGPEVFLVEIHKTANMSLGRPLHGPKPSRSHET